MLKMITDAAAEHKRIKTVREAKDGAILEVDSKNERWIIVTWNNEGTAFYVTAQNETSSSRLYKCEAKELSQAIGRMV